MNEAYRAEARRRAREQFDREYGGSEASSTEEQRAARGREIMGSDSDPAASSRDTFGIEERCRSEWASSPALRAEFSCLEAYTAFRRAEARGLVRIISRKA